MKIKYFVIGIMLLFVNLGYAQVSAYWVNNPANCPATDPAFGGQDCTPDNICGYTVVGINNVAQCYSTSVLSPTSPGTSNTDVTGAFDGGYLLNCFEPADAASPFCDNNQAYWCDRNSTCFTTQQRDTTCTAGVFGISSCGACRSGFFNCAGDINCESTSSSNCQSAPAGWNNRYDTTTCATGAGAPASGTCICDSGYGDCDSSGTNSVNGCEVQFGITNCGGGNNNNVASCGNCVCDSGFQDCDSTTPGSGNGCEWQNNAATTLNRTTTGTCNVYTCDATHFDCDSNFNNGCQFVIGLACGAGTGTYQTGQCSSTTQAKCVANANRLDCDNDDTDGVLNSCNGPNGCEITNGSACSVSGIPGQYIGCTCVIAPMNFTAGMQTNGSTLNPLLWGRQYSTGYLLNLSNDQDNLVVINNTGALGIRTGATPPIEMLDVRGNANISGYVNTTSLYLSGILSPCINGLQTDASGKLICSSIPLGGSGGGGWTTTPTTVYNNTAGVNVGIGTNSPVEKLAVVGNVNISGTVNATLIIGNLSKPTSSILGGVRATSCPANQKVTGINTEGVVTCGPDQDTITTNGTALTDVVQSIDVSGRVSGNISVTGGDGITVTRSGQIITIQNNTNVAWVTRTNTFTQPQIFSTDIRSPAAWANGGWIVDNNGNAYFQNLFVLQQINTTIIQSQTVNGTFLPYIDNQFDLGSPSKRWANVYAANLAGTLNANNLVNIAYINNKITLDASNITSGILAEERFPNVAMKNESNTFSANQIVLGSLNATDLITTNVASCSASLETDPSGKIVCGTDTPGTSVNGLTGNVMIRGSNMINITNGTDVTLTFNNRSLENLDVRQKSDNTTLANRNLFVNFPISGGGDLTANRAFGFINTSYQNLDNRQRNDNTTLAGRTISTIYPISGGGDLTSNRALTFDNTSYQNLDNRQRSDNQSVARINANNIFADNQTILGSLNISTFLNSTDVYVRSTLSCSNGLQTTPTGQIICAGNPLGSVSSVNAVTGNVLLRGSAMINITGNLSDIAFTFNNQSLENLDARQRNDNNSIASRIGNNGWTTNANVIYNNTPGVNVGIGIPNPPEKLSVVGNVNVSGYSRISRVLIGNGTIFAPSLAFNEDGDMGIYSLGQNIISFASANANRVVINGSQVGIGVTNPNAQLSIGGTNPTINIGGSNTNGYSLQLIDSDKRLRLFELNSGFPGERFSISSGGLVNISSLTIGGITKPTVPIGYLVSVGGSVNVSAAVNSSSVFTQNATVYNSRSAGSKNDSSLYFYGSDGKCAVRQYWNGTHFLITRC